VNEEMSPPSSRLNPTILIAGGEGGGEGEQISKPVPVTEPSLDQVTVDPAATCTFIGPVEPE
jgi:hypothetical protein